ncbi:MAG: ATP-grasp domain-containing protein, partial [Myxacorys chilensis ATA2-1-KO14]|nr:ATP-grasp domain-containing protein [Myxacorys chilensis ATA2-1-KO14]
MKEVNWLIERHIFDGDEQLLAELRRQNYFYKEVRYLDFRPREADRYFPDHECVLFRGTLNLGRDILRTSWIPGAYMDEKNLRCTTYYTYFGQYLLNNRYFILPLGELIRRRKEILEYFQSDSELFIRPNSNMKSFRAGVFNLQTLNTMQSLGSELRTDETTLVLVSGKQLITKEWRFFVYRDEIITGSLYLIGEERIDERIKGGYLGCVDISAKFNQQGSEINKAEKILRFLLKTRKDAAKVL